MMTSQSISEELPFRKPLTHMTTSDKYMTTSDKYNASVTFHKYCL